MVPEDCQLYKYYREPSNLNSDLWQVELAGNSSYRGKFLWNFGQGKENLGRVSGD